jgi:hypothetical protein
MHFMAPHAMHARQPTKSPPFDADFETCASLYLESNLPSSAMDAGAMQVDAEQAKASLPCRKQGHNLASFSVHAQP